MHAHPNNPFYSLPPPTRRRTHQSLWLLLRTQLPQREQKFSCSSGRRRQAWDFWAREDSLRSYYSNVFSVVSEDCSAIRLQKAPIRLIKAIKLSTDKNKRMYFFSLPQLFICLFIPLSRLCSTLCPLPYPLLGGELSLIFHSSSILLSLSGHCLPPLLCANASPCFVVYHLLVDCSLCNIYQQKNSLLHAI